MARFASDAAGFNGTLVRWRDHEPLLDHRPDTVRAT